MKFKETALAGFVALGLVACGGGGSASGDTTITAATTKYSTACVASVYTASSTTKYEQVNITVTGDLSVGSTTTSATVAYNAYIDSACATTPTSDMTFNGPVTLLSSTKTLTNSTGSKTGNKGSIVVQNITMHGITLNFSPLNQSLPFVLINEGSNVYFGNGVQAADGYPSSWSTIPAKKQ